MHIDKATIAINSFMTLLAVSYFSKVLNQYFWTIPLTGEKNY